METFSRPRLAKNSISTTMCSRSSWSLKIVACPGLGRASLESAQSKLRKRQPSSKALKVYSLAQISGRLSWLTPSHCWTEQTLPEELLGLLLWIVITRTRSGFIQRPSLKTSTRTSLRKRFRGVSGCARSSDAKTKRRIRTQWTQWLSLRALPLIKQGQILVRCENNSNLI